MKRCRVGTTKKVYPRPFFERIIKQHFYHDERQQIMFAYRQAKYGHAKQRRLDMSRYFDHPKQVALILMLEFKIFIPYAIITALFHDIMEDKTYILKWHDIQRYFGKKVYKGVRIVTKERGKQYYFGLENCDWWILLVKFADRIHNLRTLTNTDEEFAAKQILETYEKFFPLLEVLNKKVPARYRHLVDYIYEEMAYAIAKTEKHFLAK